MQEETTGRPTLEELEERIRTMLPPRYQATYKDVRPVRMGSAALRFGADGRVAWEAMWGSFCDLAMAGGPPHRGTLLAPGSADEVAQQAEAYDAVTAEICRGIGLVTGLYAQAAGVPGWVAVDCPGAAMAAWLLRAITMENVAARAGGLKLLLPAGPGYRVEREIKNVITAVAKTTHYWVDHVPYEQQGAIGALLRAMERERALVEPVYGGEGAWAGLPCEDAGEAIAAMRLLAVCNVLARREDAVVYVPAGALPGTGSEPVGALMGRVLAMVRGGDEGAR